MGDIGKVGKDGIGGFNSDNSPPTLVENSLHGNSRALQKLFVGLFSNGGSRDSNQVRDKTI